MEQSVKMSGKFKLFPQNISTQTISIKAAQI